MPELPEVETTRNGIAPHLLDQSIDRVVVNCGKLRWPVSPEIYALKDAPVKNLQRRAKYLIFEFEHGAMIVHLGMSGSLRLAQQSEPLKKHDHLVLYLSTGWQLRFHDPRRFGCVLWTEKWQQHKLISNLGIEPLSDEFNGDFLFQKSRGRKTAIKQFLMDASIQVGIGNIYANEALFLSGISPKRAVGRVSRSRLKYLAENIRQVLSRAIAQGGTTLRDFINGNGTPGYFQQQLFVYGRAGLPCKNCGSSLKEIRQNNRSTVYCPQCQK
ncbi:MAG: DNA-formamidopyrimidine glycosylase [Oleiphilus sp.]|nr:MAG: DNA-formamidopyrimidine glycosylase [Oleiphilus sp.]